MEEYLFYMNSIIVTIHHFGAIKTGSDHGIKLLRHMVLHLQKVGMVIVLSLTTERLLRVVMNSMLVTI